MTIDEFRQKQSLPYKLKVQHARQRAWEFYDKITGVGADALNGIAYYDDKQIISVYAKKLTLKHQD